LIQESPNQPQKPLGYGVCRLKGAGQNPPMRCKPKFPAKTDAQIPNWADRDHAAQRGRSSPVWKAAPPAMLRIAEAADLLQLSTKTIRRLIDKGDLRSVRIGRSIRIPLSAVQEIISVITHPNMAFFYSRVRLTPSWRE
jgi:excisionase family DNA binding protein